MQLSHRTPSRPKLRRLTLKIVFEGLAGELDQLAPLYERTRPEALSAYPTLPGLVGRLTRKDPQPQTGETSQAELVCAVLAAHQATPHRLWVAVLLRTFRPMLRHVFKKLCGSDREERLALLLTSFQEAVRRVDPHRDPVRIAMYVRQATRRGVFAALGTQRDWEQVGFGVDADETPDVGEEARTAAAERVCHLPDLQLLRTRAEPGALWEWVRRKVPGGETEQRRAYHRLRQRRLRLVVLLRNRSVTSQEAR
jgi:hypothetical protein